MSKAEISGSAADLSQGSGEWISPLQLDQEIQRSLVLHRAGRLAEASDIYRNVLSIDPDHAEANNLLGLALHQGGHHDEAALLIGKAVRRMPFNAGYHSNLGVVFKVQGRLAEAVQSYERSLRIDPNQAPVLCNLGAALLGLDRADEAVAAQRRALALMPNYAGAENQLAAALASLGRLAEARQSAERAVALQPGNAEAHHTLGRILMAMNRLDQAALSLLKSAQIRPDSVVCGSLGKVLVALGRLKEAAGAYAAAVAIDPENASLHFPLGRVYMDLIEFERAREHFAKVAELSPNDPEMLGWWGASLLALGRADEAERILKGALALDSNNLSVMSILLFASNYRGVAGTGDAVINARDFGKAIARQITPRHAHTNIADPDRRLKVGFVSGDLSTHPVARFLETVLAAIDPGQLELFAYSTGPRRDKFTERLKRNFPHWLAATYLSDDELEAAIVADGIDILLDMSGFSAGNRLPVFGRKPAPVAATWLGYFATTGLETIDYVLCSPWAIPEAEEGQWVERPWRLPETYLCFSPPDAIVPLTPPPMQSNGYVTFGSANNLNKLSNETVACWARVLEAVPGSRLLLRSAPLGDNEVVIRTKARFAAHDIGEDRLILEGSLDDYGAHLSQYNRVDIALDPFPYAGGTTSVEALWMGVPVLTLQGHSYVSHMGENILQNLAMPEWIAADTADYVRKAAAFAADPNALAALRHDLRQQLEMSPLMDAPRFARHLEAAFRGMWQRWCDEQHRTDVHGQIVT